VKIDALKTATVAVEAVVIATCALAAAQIATAQGGSIWSCAPILVIAAMECLRLPVAMTIPKMRLMTGLIAVALLVGITPMTFEGMVMAVEQFMNQRVLEVVDADTKVDTAKSARQDAMADANNRKEEVDRRSAGVKDAEHHQAEIAKQKADIQPLPPARTCVDYRKGKPNSHPCPDNTRDRIESGNREAQKIYTQQVTVAEAQVVAARKALDEAETAYAARVADVRKADAVLIEAQRADEKARAASVMHRAAASWFGVGVGDLTRPQFETFKKWAMFGVAGAAATVTMIAGFVSNMPRNDGKPSKVGMAWRAFLARRRKKLVKVVEKVVHAPALKTLVFKYVPYDPVTNRVINMDGSLGEHVYPSEA
jgi:hypothetical protein